MQRLSFELAKAATKFASLSQREKVLVSILVGILVYLVISQAVGAYSGFSRWLISEQQSMKRSLESFFVLEKKHQELLAIKAALEDSYKKYLWRNVDVGELTIFENIKARTGDSISQFKVELVSSSQFTDRVAKKVYRITFATSKAEDLISFLKALQEGEYKALPLKVKIDKKASGDALAILLELLILSEASPNNS
jgi:hypothetical protein